MKKGGHKSHIPKDKTYSYRWMEKNGYIEESLERLRRKYIKKEVV